MQIKDLQSSVLRLSEFLRRFSEVYQKFRFFMKGMDKLICYCFNYSEADIEQDVIENNGRSLILEKIKASKQEGTCRCHKTNPSSR